MSAPPALNAPSPDVLSAGRRVIREEAAALMDEFLQGLPPKKREAFVLHVIEGLTAAEIAAAIDVPDRTVYSRVRSAQDELEQFVSRRRKQLERRAR